MVFPSNRNIAALILIVAAGVISSCSGSSNSSTGSEPGDSSSTMSNFERIEAMRQESGNTKEFALAQFVAFFGQLEGAPEYSYDGSMPLFAEHAIHDIMKFEDELDDTLLDEIYDRILPFDPQPAPDAIKGDNRKGSTNPISQRNIDDTLAAQANQIAIAMGQLMGHELVADIEVLRTTRISRITVPTDGNFGIAYAPPPDWRANWVQRSWPFSRYGLENSDACWIIINEEFSFEDGPREFDQYTDKEIQHLLAHELMHCFQHELLPVSVNDIPIWMLEGPASWAGQAFVGGTDFFDESKSGHWPNYEQPEYDLFNSNGYDAIGFFSHVDNAVSGDLWNRLETIFNATTGNPQQDLKNIVEQIGTDAYAAWPSGKAMKPEWGPQWESIGVGGRNVATIPMPSGRFATAGMGEVKLLKMEIDEEHRAEPYIMTIESDGVGQMVWAESGQPLPFDTVDPQQLCTTGVCACNDGSIPTPDGLGPIPPMPANDELIVALAGKLQPDFTQTTAQSGAADEEDTQVQISFSNVSDLCLATNMLNPEPVASDLDSCLFGQWYGDLDFIEDSIRNGGEAFQQGGLTGELSVNFSSDGTANNIMDLVFAPSPTQPSLSLNGNIDFGWTANDGVYQTTYANSEVGINLVVPGSDVIIPVDSSSTPSAANGLVGTSLATADYLCNSDALIIDNRDDDSGPVRYLRERLR